MPLLKRPGAKGRRGSFGSKLERQGSILSVLKEEQQGESNY
jgi:hypothetical protein